MAVDKPVFKVLFVLHFAFSGLRLFRDDIMNELRTACALMDRYCRKINERMWVTHICHVGMCIRSCVPHSTNGCYDLVFTSRFPFYWFYYFEVVGQQSKWIFTISRKIIKLCNVPIMQPQCYALWGMLLRLLLVYLLFQNSVCCGMKRRKIAQQTRNKDEHVLNHRHGKPHERSTVWIGSSTNRMQQQTH